MKFLIFILLFLTIMHVDAYVLTKNNYGNIVKWGELVINVKVYSNLTGNEHQALVTAANSWNHHSKVKIVVDGSAGGSYETWVGNSRNDVGYSQDRTYFSESCAVLGVTTLIYETSGDIAEADILLNGFAGCLSSSSSQSTYIGNVLTHEMGHLMGLAHNEVMHSTMYYQASVGQHVLSTDDGAGMYTLYPDGSRGSISGKIIGGNDLIGIFGAHVQALSIDTGEIVASSLSEPDGNYTINGIETQTDDRYYIYVAPYKNKDSLPDYYYNIRNNFCYSDSAYRGSFYQSCNNSDAGHPYGFKVGSDMGAISTGDITIRCNLDIPDAYLANKPDDEHELDLVDNDGYIGESQVGFFQKKYNYDEENTLESIELEGKDTYQIDLTSVDFSSYASEDETLYLEYRLISQNLYSKLISKVSINGIEQNTFYMDRGNTIIYDQVGRVQISRTNSSANNFEVIIDPLNKWGKCSDSLTLTTEQMCPIEGIYASSIFRYSDDVYDSIYFYMIDFHISKKSNAALDLPENYQIVSYKQFEADMGNASCPDGPNTYQISAYIPEYYIGVRKSSDDAIFACGSVELDNSGGGGPYNHLGSLILGFFLVLIMTRRKRGFNL